MRNQTVLVAATLFLQINAFAQSPQGYYRQPSLHGQIIVFSAEGDLWKASATGGVATRLTTHAGEESWPQISPDGAQLAFTAQYEGPAEVYVMPLAGGLPKRLTWDAESARVVGWRGDKIIAATTHFSTLPSTQLTLINPSSGAREIIPLAQAAEGVYADDNKTLFFTRLQAQNSQTKRYKGGTAQNLWRFAEGDAEATPLTADYPGSSVSPLWWKDRLYFLTDRDGTMEIWSMQRDGKDAKQHTHHDLMDVKGPSLWDGKVAYQFGADLWMYDIAKNSESKLDIQLSSDFDQTREHWIKKPLDYVTSAHLSPDGDRVTLTARGQVVVAPRLQGRLIDASHNASVRNRDAKFMPDGKSLLTLSDASGEVELWTTPANGVGEPTQLTKDGDVLRWEAAPSPDGNWIAHHDKNRRLWLFNVKEKTNAKIDENQFDDLEDLRWSPDSKWLAYVAPAENQNRQIKLYNINTRQITFATTDRFDSSNPAWSPDGKWLYLLSERNLKSVVASPWGRLQPEPFFDNKTKVYQLALKKEYRSPFAPSDELHPKDDARKPSDDKDKEKTKEKEKEQDKGRMLSEGFDEFADAEEQVSPPPVQPKPISPPQTQPVAQTQPASTQPAPSQPAQSQPGGAEHKSKQVNVEIELDGLASRLIEVPLPPGNISDLALTDKKIFWTTRSSDPDSTPNLMVADIANKDVKAKELVKGATNFELSLDRSAILVRKKEGIFVLDASATAPAALEEKGIDLNNWTFPLIPRDEWRQMFTEAWRLERDYFYDTNMHGVDWKGMLARYQPMVDRVSTRAELNDLLAQMVGELSALHMFVRGGDLRQGDDKINPASLGAQLVRDESAGGYRVQHVFQHDPDRPELAAPLAKPGVDVKEGEIIESINGRATLASPDISTLLRNAAGKQVLLSVKSADHKSRQVIVVPMTTESENDLRYHEWEHTRRLAVDDKGAGEIGYVHLRAMGAENISEFARGFYPVFNRKGLIVDVRHNRGGNIDSWILEKLMRKAWFYWQPRIGQPTWNMQYAFRGHIAVLCDEFTASDGEAFSEGIKRLKIGKVIGTRTWGGEIWLSSSNVLVDKGIATAAETGVYGPEGIWLVEGHGVEPDQVVDNLPHATFTGKDAQLDAAIEYLKQKIQQEPVEVPKAPQHPDKSFKGS